jgi:hypothetical protein
MKKFEPTLEHACYALALAFALGLRFLHLGALPLSDFEADWALQALRITPGLHPAIEPNPAYVHLTAVLFYMVGATNFLARFAVTMVFIVIIVALPVEYSVILSVSSCGESFSEKVEKPRTAASLQCSKDADAKNVHGKERKKFMSECKKAAKDAAAKPKT